MKKAFIFFVLILALLFMMASNAEKSCENSAEYEQKKQTDD